MSSCDEIRPQLGAYVLGGLEPEEAAEVREHLERCPDCAREHAELAVLPAKLDLIEAPEEQAELRDRLLRAGEARAGQPTSG